MDTPLKGKPGAMAEPEIYHCKQTPFVPNSRLPVLVYRDVLPRPYDESTASVMLEKNQWLKGVCHRQYSVLSNRDRALGEQSHDITSIPTPTNATVGDSPAHVHRLTKTAVFQGASTLLLGVGPLEDASTGQQIRVEAGDVIILPAGVSHCSKDFENEYRYVGVYPEVSYLCS